MCRHVTGLLIHLIGTFRFYLFDTIPENKKRVGTLQDQMRKKVCIKCLHFNPVMVYRWF